MPWVVHLSDLHLLGAPLEQEAILRGLVATLEVERRRRGRGADLLCITGDVFDSGTLAPDRATRAFGQLLDAMHDALGGPVPTVVVPGNHDRRRAGIFLPHDRSLFDALRERLGDRAWVHGREQPFLGEVVPPSFHRLPLWVVAYDSTHLPGGVLGAGGTLRQEDVLRSAAIIDGHEPDWPVLFLLHHHLIPTPLTDLGPIETDGAPRVIRWLVERGLPRLVANADREELFMTALGAGSALSTLHAMGRAVIVLHGHKHYATARLLTAVRPAQGDLLLVSAGSAGTAQVWRPSPLRDTARLWPSFNVLDLERDRVGVETIAFGWRSESRASIARRPMVEVTRRGPRFTADVGAVAAASEPGPKLIENRARIRLVPSVVHGAARWDSEVERRVRFVGSVRRYVETIVGPRDARLALRDGVRRVGASRAEMPADVVLHPDRTARYRVDGAVARTIDEEARIGGRQATPFGRVELMNRYACERATLVLEGIGKRARTAFGSATDLGTGLPRPLPVAVEPEHDRVRLVMDRCPPRTLLRIHWLLEDDRLPATAGFVPPSSSAAEPPADRSALARG